VRAEGIGLGLRSPIAKELFSAPPPAVRWLEIHPENYLARGGHYETLLREARARFPLLTHGLSMGFGSLTPFTREALAPLRALLSELAVPWHSDHLCFAAVDGVFAHDLLPLPFNEQAIDVCVQRIREAQDALGVPIAVEHISYYMKPAGSALSELDHLNEVLTRADAKLLLDVNNVYVNAMNHGFDPYAFIAALPLSRVVQVHVAGHYVRPDGQRIDTHAEPVCEAVFALFEYTMKLLARPLPVLLERDDNFPEFSELSAEVTRLDEIYRRVLGERAPLSDPLPQAEAMARRA
jgi:uncharacterized protein (UPF0276 family)